jgi:hypothetical protein
MGGLQSSILPEVIGSYGPIAVIPSEAMSWMAYTNELWNRYERVFAAEA